MSMPSQLQVLATRHDVRPARPSGRFARADAAGELTIRLARHRDGSAVAHIEALEERRLPDDGARLVARLDGRVVAAMAIIDGSVVADPFEPTAAAVEMLRVRARQLRRSGRGERPPRLTLIERLATR